MPYAYGAKIRHEFLIDHLNIWVTFRHPMQRSEIPQTDPPVYDWMPPLNLWLLEADAAPVDIIDSEWQDEFTILLTSDTIIAEPNRVLLAYAGPDDHLQTTWGKDWEPWGPILSTDVVKFPCFVDRGDPAAFDFEAGDFTIDGNWHDLNLSSIVPANAKAVLFTLEIRSNTVNAYFFLRKKGNVNIKVNASGTITTADISYRSNLICACDADRLVQYLVFDTPWTYIRLTVGGWWF